MLFAFTLLCMRAVNIHNKLTTPTFSSMNANSCSNFARVIISDIIHSLIRAVNFAVEQRQVKCEAD